MHALVAACPMVQCEVMRLIIAVEFLQHLANDLRGGRVVAHGKAAYGGPPFVQTYSNMCLTPGPVLPFVARCVAVLADFNHALLLVHKETIPSFPGAVPRRQPHERQGCAFRLGAICTTTCWSSRMIAELPNNWETVPGA